MLNIIVCSFMRLLASIRVSALNTPSIMTGCEVSEKLRCFWSIAQLDLTFFAAEMTLEVALEIVDGSDGGSNEPPPLEDGNVRGW